MKKFYFLLLGLFLFTTTNAQIINFPDANFKANLLAADSSNTIAQDISGNNFKIDSNNNGEIEVNEALQVYKLNFDLLGDNAVSGISDLTSFEYFTNLASLNLNYNNPSLVNLNNLTNLRIFECSNCNLSSLDVSNLTNLTSLICSGNQVSSLDVSNLTNLTILDCTGNQISSLDVSNLTNLTRLGCSSNPLHILDVSNLTNLTSLSCSYNQLSSLDVSNLTNLTNLSCSNNSLSSLDVSNLTNLTNLSCSNNSLSSLDVGNLTNLTDLNCDTNQISSLNVSNLTNLTTLDCSINTLSSLDVSHLTNLIYLYCSKNQITSLDVIGLTNLTQFSCGYNQLTSLDVSGLKSLESLYCSYNQLSSIDISTLILMSFGVDNNPALVSIFMKNGHYDYGYFLDNFFTLENCPNLQYICTDEDEVAQLQSFINSYSYTNCHVNSYCSFTPGGEFYTIQGNTIYDEDNNGCDGSDSFYPNLKFDITGGAQSGSIISDTSGNFSIPVQAGTYTITPIEENSDYFNISSTSFTVTFPIQASPFIQNICTNPNGVHPDLEITIIPTSSVRPGFDATYKIIYKNKGNTTQSGSINLTFDDSVLDFVSANPVTTSQTVNNLSWDFTNLLPFETREITLTLNVNAPTDTPAVNNGDELDYTANITSPATDETPNDNISILHQVVVNSLDPNDKTCLEGTTITPAMVGEYVHYVIRFENTGTFSAQNIVVKDMIDTAKFDINTLIPIKGSHEFVTKISDTNKVEFIFENINLPFDDANNDGFVAFKIKTKSSLVVGDTFDNSANIYFDYNFPIVTNTATTTVQTLGKSDFEFAKYFTVYPNPAVNTLNLSTKSGISVNVIAIYNTLGQLVIAIPNAQSVSDIDVSSLRTGNYFIKITSDKRTSNTKFIKK